MAIIKLTSVEKDVTKDLDEVLKYYPILQTPRVPAR